MRPCASVAGTRCTRCTPLSYFSRLKTSLPVTCDDDFLEAAAGRVSEIDMRLDLPAAASRRSACTCGTDRRRTAPPRRRRCRRGSRGWRCLLVVGIARQEQHADLLLERLELRLELGELGLGQLAHVGIRLREHFACVGDGLGGFAPAAPRLDQRADAAGLLAQHARTRPVTLPSPGWPGATRAGSARPPPPSLSVSSRPSWNLHPAPASGGAGSCGA